MKKEKLGRRIDKGIWMPLHRDEFREIAPDCRLRAQDWFEKILWEGIWLNIHFVMVDQLEEDVYK